MLTKYTFLVLQESGNQVVTFEFCFGLFVFLPFFLFCLFWFKIRRLTGRHSLYTSIFHHQGSSSKKIINIEDLRFICFCWVFIIPHDIKHGLPHADFSVRKIKILFKTLFDMTELYNSMMHYLQHLTALKFSLPINYSAQNATHLTSHLFEILPSGWWYKSMKLKS